MKKLTLLLGKPFWIGSFIILFTTASFAQKGSGEVIKEKRDVRSFTEITVGGAFEIFLRQGDVEDVTIVTDDNIMEYVTTTVSSGELKLKLDNKVDRFTELKAYITVKELNALDLSGACNLTGKNTIVSKDLEIELSGASDVKIAVQCTNLEVESSGASDMEISGSATYVEIDASGASTIKGSGLNSNTATIESSGASTVKISVSNTLKADASGASTILYKGKPNVEAHESGAADIKKM